MAEYEWLLSQLRGTVLALLNESYIIEQRIMLARHDQTPEEEIARKWRTHLLALRAPFRSMCQEFKSLMRTAGYPEEEIEKIRCP